MAHELEAQCEYHIRTVLQDAFMLVVAVAVAVV
jgi:hypothetical protein